MKIECILKRAGGTVAELEGVEYHFTPQDDGAHVAEIEKRSHIERFLSIPSAYCIYDPSGAPKLPEPVAAVVEPAPDVLYGSDVHSASFEIGGKTYQLGDVVRLAFENSGRTVEEWNDMEPEDRAAAIDVELDKLEESADVNGDGVVDSKDERAALAAEYQAKFGKAPHHRLSIDSIKAKLAEG